MNHSNHFDRNLGNFPNRNFYNLHILLCRYQNIPIGRSRHTRQNIRLYRYSRIP
ncbi:MAG: hypothetical protein IJS63_06375 [Bacteroidaceae bacterium]|nr:hypothetical protein [Bacteroidaceae bacterium]